MAAVQAEKKNKRCAAENAQRNEPFRKATALSNGNPSSNIDYEFISWFENVINDQNKITFKMNIHVKIR